LQSGDPGVRLPAAVVGAIDYVGAVLNCKARVIRVLNPLDRDRELGLAPNPAQVLPRERMDEDFQIVLQGSRVVFVRWFGEMFGEVLV
jgi:hypothetical protein